MHENIFTYYLGAAISRWKVMLALLVTCTVAGFAISAFVLVHTPSFEASSRLNVVPTSQELGYADRYARGQATQGGVILLQTFGEGVRSRETLGEVTDGWIEYRAARAGKSPEQWVAESFGPPSLLSPGVLWAYLNYWELPNLTPREQVIEELTEEMTIEYLEGTFLMQITVAWDDPDDAAWLANALAEAVIANAEAQSLESKTQLTLALESEMQNKSVELAGKKRLAREQKINLGVVDLDRQKQALLDEQLAEQSRLTTALATAREAETRVASLRSRSSDLLSPTQSSIEEQLAIEEPRAEAARRAVATRQARLRTIRAELETFASAELRVKNLDDNIAALEAEVADLTRRIQFNATDNVAAAPTIRLVDRAVAPLTRSSPKIFLNTIIAGFIGCTLCGIILVLFGPAAPAKNADEEDEDDSADAWAHESPDMAFVPPRYQAAGQVHKDDFEPEPFDEAEPKPSVTQLRPHHAARSESPAAPKHGRSLTKDDARTAPMASRDFDQEKAVREPQDGPARPVAQARSQTSRGGARPLAIAIAETEEPDALVADADAELVADYQPSTEMNEPWHPSQEDEAEGDKKRGEMSVFSYLLPLAKDGVWYSHDEIRGIAEPLFAWISDALHCDRELAVSAIDESEDSLRLIALMRNVMELNGCDLDIALREQRRDKVPVGFGEANKLTLVPERNLSTPDNMTEIAATGRDVLVVGRKGAQDRLIKTVTDLMQMTSSKVYVVCFED